MLTATDYFCGMGGSSSGLTEAGYSVQVAANHWERAIETHAANHPDTEHLCADIQKIDVRYLPKSDLLWASPICTELSPAGGRKRRRADQTDLWQEHGHVSSEAFERTRVTFWEVLRSAEVHNHPAVLVENVVEAADWHLLPTWLHGWETLGYNVQIICVSAAHVGDEGNPHAPQWRDRMYFGITRKDVRLPDFAPRPLAWCEECREVVPAVQWWKPKTRRINGQPVGKYGAQYVYVCPAGHAGTVEPYVAPAAAAIDWTDLGIRIGDREDLGMRKLGAATIKRIEHGLRVIGDPALVASVGNTSDAATGHRTGYYRAWPAMTSPSPVLTTTSQNGIAMTPAFRGGFTTPVGGTWRKSPDRLDDPMKTRLTRDSDALVLSEPFVTMLRNHGRPTGVDEPLATFSTARHHGLTVPPGSFIAKQFGGRLRDEDAVYGVDRPMHSAVSQSAPTLVIPYRKNSKPYPADDGPLSTLATREAHGVLHAPELVVEDCYFRMLKPREAASAQRFAPDYVIHGNKGEQQMQAGNAVAVNVAHWLGRQTAEVLG